MKPEDSSLVKDLKYQAIIVGATQEQKEALQEICDALTSFLNDLPDSNSPTIVLTKENK